MSRSTTRPATQATAEVSIWIPPTSSSTGSRQGRGPSVSGARGGSPLPRRPTGASCRRSAPNSSSSGTGRQRRSSRRRLSVLPDRLLAKARLELGVRTTGTRRERPWDCCDWASRSRTSASTTCPGSKSASPTTASRRHSCSSTASSPRPDRPAADALASRRKADHRQ